MDRKLLAKSFLHGVGKMMFIATGNCLRQVSYLAWGEDDVHSDGKLLATGFLSGVGKMMLIVTGNGLRQVSCAAQGGWYS